MFFTRSTTIRKAALAALLLVGIEARASDFAQCKSLFADKPSASSLQALELQKTVSELAQFTKNFENLPQIPSSYMLHELENFPRNQWLKQRPKEIGADYYNKIYKLEQSLQNSKSLDPAQTARLYEQLAKLYLSGRYAKEAVWTYYRAGREDLANWLVESVKFQLPESPSGRVISLTDFLIKIKTDTAFQENFRKLVVDQAKENHWSELEIEAKRLKDSSLDGSKHASQKLYQRLGEDYLQHSMYQEAIWAFRAADNLVKANELQEYLLQVLSTNELQNTNVQLSGVTGAKLYYLAPGIQVIAKNQSSFLKGNQKPKDEVLAYKLSELLNLDMVSTTILRTINGETHSLQLMIHRMNHQTQWLDYNTQNKNQETTMNIFDYLIANQDRRNQMGAHNSLTRMGGVRALIDHGIIFRPYYLQKHIPFLKNRNQNIDMINDPTYGVHKNTLDPKLIESLEKLDLPEYKEALRSIFSGGFLSLRYQMFESRRIAILKAIQDPS